MSQLVANQLEFPAIIQTFRQIMIYQQLDLFFPILVHPQVILAHKILGRVKLAGQSKHARRIGGSAVTSFLSLFQSIFCSSFISLSFCRSRMCALPSPRTLKMSSRRARVRKPRARTRKTRHLLPYPDVWKFQSVFEARLFLLEGSVE